MANRKHQCLQRLVGRKNQPGMRARGWRTRFESDCCASFTCVCVCVCVTSHLTVQPTVLWVYVNKKKQLQKKRLILFQWKLSTQNTNYHKSHVSLSFYSYFCRFWFPCKSCQEVLFTKHLGITRLPEARKEKDTKFIFSVWLGFPWSYSSPWASIWRRRGSLCLHRV